MTVPFLNARPLAAILRQNAPLEQRDWDKAFQKVRVSEFLLPSAYAEALPWAQQPSADALAA